MFIAMIASECAPVAKVGGLADVVYGLSRELAIRGHTVEIVLPKYDCMRHDQVSDLQRTPIDLWVPWADGEVHCTVWLGLVHGCTCFFTEPHDNDGFFNRGAFYGFPDDYQRFAFFSKAPSNFFTKPASDRTSSTRTIGRRLWCRCCCMRSTSRSAWIDSGCVTPSTTSPTRELSVATSCG